MKSLFITAFAALACTVAGAESATATAHTRFAGVYRVYGGGLGDPVAPKASDTKIMFSVDGQVARDMFDAMGPDVQDACTAGTSIRVRKKDNENLVCLRYSRREYSCNFGFQLKTGKSIGGSIC